MAVTIPTGCYRQSNEDLGIDSNGYRTMRYILKGRYDTLENFLKQLKINQEFENGYKIKELLLNRVAGDVGLLTATCKYEENEDSEKEQDDFIDETWTLKSIRNDVSILAYCGPSAGAANRAYIEAWMKEPDGQLAKNGQFRRSDGSIFMFGATTDDEGNAIKAEEQKIRLSSWDVCGKILKGIDSVMRFYPMLTKTNTYLKMPAKVYENLATIDLPIISKINESSSDDKGEQGSGEIGEFQPVMRKVTLNKPGNLQEIIDSHEWLKCQDDLEKSSDGNFRRVQSWIGVLQADGGWDENLYSHISTIRWPMPYKHS